MVAQHREGNLNAAFGGAKCGGKVSNFAKVLSETVSLKRNGPSDIAFHANHKIVFNGTTQCLTTKEKSINLLYMAKLGVLRCANGHPKFTFGRLDGQASTGQ
eukprot:3342463-Amphidinium_carterae.1